MNDQKQLAVQEFSVCYISTLALPVAFRDTRHEETLKKDIEDLSGYVRDHFSCEQYKSGCRCWGKEEAAAGKEFDRASCRCFELTDNFLKEPSLGNDYYCERIRLLRIETPEGIRIDFIASLYYRLGYANILVNASSRGKNGASEKTYSPDDIIRVRDFLTYLPRGEKNDDIPGFDTLSGFREEIAKLSGRSFGFGKPEKKETETPDGAPVHTRTIRRLCYEFARYLQLFMLDYNNNRYPAGERFLPEKGETEHVLARDRFKVKEYCHNITEIKRIETEPDDETVVIDDGFIGTYVQNLYGILTTDEGYSFVPVPVAREALKNTWGTRTFTRCFMFGNSMLVLNFKPDDYKTLQLKQSRNIYIDRDSDYFLLDSCIAGLDHCFLENVEKACLSQYAIRRALSKKVSTPPSSNIVDFIHETGKLRQDILKIINKSYINTKELNSLLRQIYLQKGIFTDISDLKYKLDRNNDELTFLYNRQENSKLTILTVATVLTAIFVGLFMLNDDIPPLWKIYTPLFTVYIVAGLLVLYGGRIWRVLRKGRSSRKSSKR